MNVSQTGNGGQGGPRLGDLLPCVSVAPQQSAFQALWDLGYRRLVPIVPPDAKISERSSLAKRVGTARDPRGKAPGVRWPDGSWSGFDWINHNCDERDVERWARMGAGVGIKTGPQDDGTWLVGIDADTLHKDQAAFIAAEVRASFGVLPTRIGKAPKALYVVRLASPLTYCRIEFANADSGDGERVEILSEGKQFVAFGVHPGTGAPYRWTEPLPPFGDLPIHEPAELA